MGQVHLAYAAPKSRYLPAPKKERDRLLIPIVEAILALSSQNGGNYQPQTLTPLHNWWKTIHQQVGSDDPARVDQF